MLCSKSIPGDVRLALRVNKITVFHGGVVHVRCVHAPASADLIDGKFAPQVVELDVPSGLIIVPPSPSNAGYNVTDVTLVPGGGLVPSGYTRVRLEKTRGAAWDYLNEAIMIKTAIAPGSEASLEGKTFALARIRAYNTATRGASSQANQKRTDNWQPLAMTVKKLVPVLRMPTRLHTAYCWSNADAFADNASLGLDSISTWKHLGFNTIPTDGASYAMPPAKPGPILSPANRSGSQWQGLKYGIMTSPFLPGGFSSPPYGIASFAALRLKNVSAADGTRPPNGFNFSSVPGMTPAREQVERGKWRAALQFYNDTGIMDLAYDGFFRQNDYATVSKLVAYAQPDAFSFDIESFPFLEAYAKVGWQSDNFAAGKQPNETDGDATLRMAQSWLGGVVDAARSASSTPLKLKPYLYGIPARFDAGFQITTWNMAKQDGIADMPSYYGVQNGLDVVARSIRQERLAVGTKSELVPWFTPGETTGTGGPQSADPGRAMFNILIQAFGSGATGFNIYTTEGMYDMALWLAMRDAIAIATPHEDLLCDGTPASAGTFVDVAPSAVLSAMKEATGGALLIASSTMPHGLATEFSVVAEGANVDWLLCDCGTLVSSNVSAGGVAHWRTPQEDGSVLLMASLTPCH